MPMVCLPGDVPVGIGVGVPGPGLPMLEQVRVVAVAAGVTAGSCEREAATVGPFER